MIILLGKHEHVKAIIGIYNIIYDQSCGKITYIIKFDIIKLSD